MSFKIAVVGSGYVGLVSAATFAATGNKVVGVDIDAKKVDVMNSGETPIYEPGLKTLLQRNLNEKRISFTTDLESAALFAEVIFLCLPTPPNEDGSADLSYVLKVAADLAEIFKRNDPSVKKIIVNKSTVPVGAGDKVKAIFDAGFENHNLHVASNPEFLREGYAIEDAMKPERVVIGAESDYVRDTMKSLYAPFLRTGNPIYFMDLHSAEVTKYAANAFLATKISFMNELSEFCEKVGADIEKIRLGIGSDTRIGNRFLFAGLGYGGSCFPKDVRALEYSAKSVGVDLAIVKSAKEANFKQISRFVDKITNKMGEDLTGKKFALWGLAFKPETDDTREAPAFDVIEALLARGASIIAFDQEAMENTKLRFADKIEYADTAYQCLEGCDALIIATEWTLFRNPDFDVLSEKLNNKIIFDGRNLFEPESMKQMGFEYYCIGRIDSSVAQ